MAGIQNLDETNKSKNLPGSFHLRPARMEDLVAVLRLRVAQYQADYHMEGLTAGGLRQSWLAPQFHLGQDHWLVQVTDGEAAAYGELRGDRDLDFDIALAAAPALWEAGEPGQRAGLSLLERIEQRAVELAGGQPYRLGCRLGTQSQAMVHLVETFGFTRRLTFHIMDADLRTPLEAPALPPGMSIRTFLPGQDDMAVYRADEEASEDKGYHQPLSYEGWCERMGRLESWFDPGLWFLAFINGELAGAALNFYQAANQTAWVDHLGVRRAYRQRGVGMALLRQSLLVFQQSGYPLARLSVDSQSLTHAPRLYEQAGFKTVMGYHIYRK